MFRERAGKRLAKKAKRGFRGYPVGTIAFYGPDNRRASKVAVSVIPAEGREPVLERWFSEGSDVRTDRGSRRRSRRSSPGAGCGRWR